jgi:ABC-type dipeptide/oligopeptide/nickel transport system permease component
LLTYSVRRILLAVPMLLALLTLIFLLIRIVPGDPAVAALGDYASREAVNAFREKMGLNLPIYVQYMQFLSSLARGDLGRSLISGVSVSSLVVRALPYTIELTVGGVLVGIMLGIPIGIFTALRRNTMFDYLGRIFSLAGLSTPAFLFGILLMLAFSVKLDLFPVIGGGDINNIWNSLYYLCLPAFSLGLLMTAYITRMTRSSILNVLQEDYVRTARAKGLKKRTIIYGHAFRNALIPIVSVVGVYSIALIGDSVMTEIVFSRPGLGKLIVGAMLQRDYITIQSIMAIYAVFVFAINLISDLCYGIIDPRVRYE